MEKGINTTYMIIGLTGTMLSGKSTVLKIFKTLGAGTLSADAIVHDLLKTPSVQQKIEKTFGTADPVKLKKVFKSDAERKKLESILHPLVIKEGKKIIKALPQKVIVYEIPLLFENELEKNFDLTISVSCNKSVLAARLKKRGISKKDFAARSAAQFSDDVKLSKSDIAVLNNGTIKELENKIKRMYKVLK